MIDILNSEKDKYNYIRLSSDYYWKLYCDTTSEEVKEVVVERVHDLSWGTFDLVIKHAGQFYLEAYEDTDGTYVFVQVEPEVVEVTNWILKEKQ